jgi:hypothetical protein
LPVDGPHAYRLLGYLAGLDDGIVPFGDVLEVGEERKHFLDRPPDRHGVLEGGHKPLLPEHAYNLAAKPGSLFLLDPADPRTKQRYGL